MSLPELLSRYQVLLSEADAWFARCQAAQPQAIVCASGCSGCCRGLFDITLLDAALLRHGFDQLPAATQQQVRQQATLRLAELQQQWPELAPPYVLNLLPDELWTEMPEDDLTPCPLLDAAGHCRVYAFRPMTCRLHGLPHLDCDGTVYSDDWCTHNFVATPPGRQLDWEFSAFYRREFALQQELAVALAGVPLTELDTFIPLALLIDFAGFDWHGWRAREFSRLTRHR